MIYKDYDDEEECVSTYSELMDYLDSEEKDYDDDVYSIEYDEDDIDSPIYEVEYTNASGMTNTFRIAYIRESHQYGDEYIDAYCIDKDGEPEDLLRTFKIIRFDEINEE